MAMMLLQAPASLSHVRLVVLLVQRLLIIARAVALDIISLRKTIFEKLSVH